MVYLARSVPLRDMPFARLKAPPSPRFDHQNAERNVTRRIPALQPTIVGLVAAAIYANTLQGGFVSDDLYVTVNNPAIRSLDSIPGYFATSFWPDEQTPNYYRPLPNVISTLAYAAFGLRAWGHHLVNVAIHVIASLLAFAVARRLLHDRGEAQSSYVPLFAAGIFATHPIHTEAVAWVAGLPDLTYSALFLLAFLLHLKARDGARFGYGLSAVAFFLSALCKEAALVFPAVVACYDWTTTSKGARRAQLARYAPLVIAAAGYVALRWNALGGFAPVPLKARLDGGAAVANAVALFAKYMGALAAPVRLNALHVVEPRAELGEPRVIAGLIVVVAFGALAAVAARRRTVVLTALAFIAAPLLPVLYSSWLNGKDFGERFLYLPCFGFALLLAAGVRWSRNQPTLARVAPAAAVALIVAYAWGTAARNPVWKSDYTLYADVVTKSPSLPEPHMYVGYVAFGEGSIDEARDHFRLAMVDEHYSRKVLDTLNTMGNESAQAGKQDEAIRHYQLALDLDPRFADTHSNLGVAYARQGRLEDAIRKFEDALALNPDDDALRYNLAIARQELATRQMQRALTPAL